MATRPQDVGTPSVIETARLRLEPWSDAPLRALRPVHARPGRDPLHPRRAPRPGGARSSNTSTRSRSGVVRLRRTARSSKPARARWLGFVELALVGPGKGSRDDDVEIGYFVGPDRWRQGIATEAAIASARRGVRALPPRRADRTLPGRERRLGARARQGRLQLLRLFELRRRHHRRDSPPPARPGRPPARPPLGLVREGGHATGAEYRETG